MLKPGQISLLFDEVSESGTQINTESEEAEKPASDSWAGGWLAGVPGLPPSTW